MADFRSQVDRLRYRFFEIDVDDGNGISPEKNPEKPASARGAWVIAAAILLGALIVSGAFLCCF